MVVSALTCSITKKMEQIVSQEMKKMRPGLVIRGLLGMERDMVTKLGGLENRLAKELATSQSREAISRAVAKGVTEMVYGSYRQAFGQQAAGFERAMGSMLQQVSEQFMAGSREYEAALGRRMEVENVGVKDIVAPLCVHSAGDGWGAQEDEGDVGEDEGGSGGHHQEGGGDDGWGDWAGGEGYCEEGSGECSGCKKCLHDPSARCEEHYSPSEHPVTSSSRETQRCSPDCSFLQ